MLSAIQIHTRFSRRRVLATATAMGAFLKGYWQLEPGSLDSVLAGPVAPGDNLLEQNLDALAIAMLRESPERATELAVSQAQAGGTYANKLDDRSASGTQRRIAIFEDSLARLKAIDRPTVSRPAAISLDVVLEAISNALAGARFAWGRGGFDEPRPYVVDQLNSAHIAVPALLDSKHAIKSRGDIEDFLARLSALADVLDQETERVQADAKIGVVPPRFIVAHCITQLDALAAVRPEESVPVESLRRRTANVDWLKPAEATRFVAQAIKITSDKITPAYRRQSTALAVVQPLAGDDAGLWRLKDGDAFYTAALKAWTTSTLSPDSIHAMGYELLKEISSELDAVLRGQGLTSGSIGARLAKLTADPKQLYPNTESGRAELLAYLNGLIERLQPVLPKYFGLLARARLEIRRVPLGNESGSSGGYYENGALDGSRPGTYYINLRDTAEWPKFLLPTLTYHEGEPGHHWQISIAQETAGLPLVRRALLEFTGYTEGWALYAEDLADEMGMYADDPLARIGYLQFALFRAARLIVDTGIHAMRWSKEQAVQFMIESTGRHPNTVVTEVERYAVQPGQACSYMIGRQAIRHLRERAHKLLGPAFDIRQFHDRILENGAMPLSILDTVVTAGLAANATAPRP